ncbi:MAG: hypothetical protein U0793_22870 [Gemmataceae bacterium]
MIDLKRDFADDLPFLSTSTMRRLPDFGDHRRRRQPRSAWISTRFGSRGFAVYFQTDLPAAVIPPTVAGPV